MARLTRMACIASVLSSAACSAWIDTDPSQLGPLTAVVGSCETGCDDGISCTTDSCVNNSCQHTAQNDRCGDKELCDATRGCVPTSSTCDPSKADCWSCDTPKVDSDNDGHFAKLGNSTCGDDCADGDNTIYSGAKEVCDGKDNDCNGMIDDGCGTGGPVPSCTTARVTMLANGRATVMGSLGATAPAKFETACGNGIGRGAIYLIDVPQLADVVLDTTGSDFPTLVAAGTVCNTKGGFAVGCAGPIRPTENASRLVIHRYDPAIQGRSLFVLVDALASRPTGNFKLDISVQPAVSYVCPGLLGAPYDLTKGGTVVGYMSASGSFNGSCMSGAGPAQAEAVFRYTASAVTNLRCEAKSVSFAPALYAQTVCGIGNGLPFGGDLDCEQAAGSGIAATIDLRLQPADSPYIIVDNGREGGRYELTCSEK